MHEINLEPGEFRKLLREGLRAAVQGDVYDLAWALENTPSQARPWVCALIVHEGLMIGPWPMRVLLWWLRRKPAQVAVGKLTYAFRRKPGVADELIRATCEHIRLGDDTEDETSHGGFSQREVNKLRSILHFAILKE